MGDIKVYSWQVTGIQTPEKRDSGKLRIAAVRFPARGFMGVSTDSEDRTIEKQLCTLIPANKNLFNGQLQLFHIFNFQLP